MSLESLANELLLDLFEYFDIINLFRAFRGLNIRFDQLLLIKLQNYYLDFRSISKRDFEIFCQQNFPSINTRIISLHLSDDIETPNLIELFLSFGYRINQFIHLKSFSIDYICSFDLLNQITSQCRELSHLTRLSIIINTNRDPEENFRDFINNIWSLSKLTHCYLDIQYPYTIYLLNMSVISQSINYLSTKNVWYNSDSLFHLFKHTPNLQRLSIGSIGQFTDQRIQPIFSSLISLRMTDECSMQCMTNLFQNISNVRYLTLVVNNVYLDGQGWEKILTKHFRNIEVFHFKMTIEFSPSEDVEEQVDQLLDSFRSDYWIEKHRWFVRCDWCPMHINETGLLYTLPYAFDVFNYTDCIRSKSTSPKELNYSCYDRVQTLHHTNRKKDFCKNWIPFSGQFRNIRHLKIKFPFDDNFWSVIPTLDRLVSLYATLNQDFGYAQLQTLLDRAPRLYSLRFSYPNNFSMRSFNINSTSIRQLEFFQNIVFHLRLFNTAECDILAKSSIASQCEVLIIDVKSRTNILELINAMPNLRALSVRCEYDQNHQHEASETKNDLIEWLNNHLPFKHTVSIIQNIYNNSHINLWIHR